MFWRAFKWFFNRESPFVITADILILFFFAYEIWIQGWLKSRTLADTFELRLTTSSVTAATEQQVIMAALFLRHTTVLTGFNVRFVEEHRFNRRPDNVDPNVIRVIGVNVLRHTDGQLACVDDAEGGFDCEFITPQHSLSIRTYGPAMIGEFIAKNVADEPSARPPVNHQQTRPLVRL